MSDHISDIEKTLAIIREHSEGLSHENQVDAIRQVRQWCLTQALGVMHEEATMRGFDHIAFIAGLLRMAADNIEAIRRNRAPAPMMPAGEA